MKNTQQTKNIKTTPPYKLGFLGLIPLVGFFVGIALILYGIFRYKDKKLIVIGASCIIFTVLIYSALSYMAFYSDIGKIDKEKLAQTKLNSIVAEIEYYKNQNGNYPDSLTQVKKDAEVLLIADPTSRKNIHYFKYINLGENYRLFSVGSDQIENTSDDIFPQIKNLKNVGWIK